MLTLQNITYLHPNKEPLFQSLNLSFPDQAQMALVGNNGTGKSTLLKLIAGELVPTTGQVLACCKPYLAPQHFGQYNGLSIARALRVDHKLEALRAILDGQVTESLMMQLDEDWTIEERCLEALAYWGLQDLSLRQSMDSLSGGQKTRVFLAGINIHQPEILLLDEPTNHLDGEGRRLLAELLQSRKQTTIVVSHDRQLLELLNPIVELTRRGATVYGGNYSFYEEQKAIADEALQQDLRSQEKALRKAKEVERQTIERQQKLDARGKKKQENAGLPTISMNTFRNNAEKSTARIKGAHAEKVGTLYEGLQELRKAIPGMDRMQFGFEDSALHKGKILLKGEEILAGYNGRSLWREPLDIQVVSGERIALCGGNGSGKTTLIRLLLGQQEPLSGQLYRAPQQAVYIDQDYSLVSDTRSVYEQAQQFNTGGLQEHEVKIRLNRFLFTPDYWDKSCRSLSGGEKMRLLLCCLTLGRQAPDIIILDEPTNNLDILNIEILTAAINGYKGTLIVVSHDSRFLEEVGISRTIDL
ncbi:MAG: ABC-F family ATP-binding cassette domain-containing protein [Candidatus Pseudobacter hemicellulosilyticus]|uniref:ABC-F family ATP-binding cassette domain-containing protein n=1 Tax=Candidatus Pseudobacter hemicellulosilyticus TaxID=3121375 RepID=A0AAJ6BEQ5_9BACT|nr:MAG: ABC-F family ATP-binding cassette domain-containing protein [Pseudobacter sp.]